MFFFFNDTATTEIYTLSLHDALPIWNVVNIPGAVNSISQNASADDSLPGGALEIRNDYGSAEFGGACPPPGEVHRYIFTVYALGTERLELPENPSNAQIGRASCRERV